VNEKHFPLALSLVLSVIAAAGAAHSYHNYWFTRYMVVEDAKVLKPLDYQNTWRFIEPQLAANAKVGFVRDMIAYRVEDAQRLQKLWLHYAESQGLHSRDELILWSATFVISVGGAAWLLRRRNAP
jgi:hypothetical protein